MKKLSKFIFGSVVFVIILILALSINYKHDSTAFAGASEELAPRSEDEQRIIDVYRSQNETVAFITTRTVSLDLFGIQSQEGTGSGVVVDSKRAIIVTNFHVIKEADHIEVSLANGAVYEAKLLGLDPENDIAVLKVVNPPSDLKAASFGDSSKLEVGQRVVAIGNPYGLNRTLTTGIISSLNRSIRSPTKHLMKGLIQTDAAINPGNSGGPLLDTAGRLIGINSAILSHSGDSAGIGFAIPVNYLKRELPELIATGRVLRPEMGWVLVDTDQGPMVDRVLADSPAATAGVQPILRRVEGSFITGYVSDISRADLVYKVNGVRVINKDQIEDIISANQNPEGLEFELRRGGVQGRPRMVKIKPVLQ